jgi:hypothetical protein
LHRNLLFAYFEVVVDKHPKHETSLFLSYWVALGEYSNRHAICFFSDNIMILNGIFIEGSSRCGLLGGIFLQAQKSKSAEGGVIDRIDWFIMVNAFPFTSGRRVFERADIEYIPLFPIVFPFFGSLRR